MKHVIHGELVVTSQKLAYAMPECNPTVARLQHLLEQEGQVREELPIGGCFVNSLSVVLIRLSPGYAVQIGRSAAASAQG
jgi:hypothetical protein